ncbi:MAG: accessory Sec system translocase SecA2 [bacterium]|nr:accessory Sec system translocase SecA2 [bacterium]
MKHHPITEINKSIRKYKIQRELNLYKHRVEQINKRRLELETARDGDLQKISEELQKQVRDGASLDDLLVEAFALSSEVARRVLKLRPFDVQLAAGIALHEGTMVQMQTGEGKTLSAVMPAYLNALGGKGVHVLTVNDYLARRDAEWMGAIYNFLGLSTAFIQEGMTAEERIKAYASDILYVTAREAGFDFLRDQRCIKATELVQRRFNFVIVDEADSIMIDEGRIPLVIAGEAPVCPTDPYELTQLIRSLEEGRDYEKDEYSRDVNFTEAGLDRLEEYLGFGNLHEIQNNRLLAASNLALQAELLLKRDIDYIVRSGKVELVDEFTGRVADKRRWPYGLQTAIEAKEKLDVQPEGIILGSITLQHFLKLYAKISGMTATAETSTKEFDTFYQLKVITIPPNRLCIRTDHKDIVFSHKAAKREALVREIIAVHATGRPILVGTASVEESEMLAKRLEEASVENKVLNAKNDEAEAGIIAEAGARGAVTISTNMAGRGTDIRLGGKQETTREHVVALGGLYVIGTNRHESRRIDLQLRGRSGRQGDPGSSRFFVSMEDDLMVKFKVLDLVPEKHVPTKQEEPVKSRVVASEIGRVQRIVEGQNLEIRKTLRLYSQVVEEQRAIFQGRRLDILRDREPLTLLETEAEEKHKALVSAFGKDVLYKVEKEITLFHIDRLWTEHLEFITYIREGVHLWGWGGRIPSFEFQKQVIKAFDEMTIKLEESIVETFNRVRVTAQGIDAEKEGLTGPSSTWTYLISDNPFESTLKGVLIGSNAFAFGAGLAMLPYLPFILAARLIKYFRKKHH